MNMQQMMKQAQAMQKKMQEMQEKIANTEYEGKSGGDMVQVTINGKFDLLNVKLDPAVIDPEDSETLEDLLVAAFNVAKKKAEEESANEASDLTGGLQLPPGFKLPF